MEASCENNETYPAHGGHTVIANAILLGDETTRHRKPEEGGVSNRSLNRSERSTCFCGSGREGDAPGLLLPLRCACILSPRIPPLES
jgi:hypothetical protein